MSSQESEKAPALTSNIGPTATNVPPDIARRQASDKFAHTVTSTQAAVTPAKRSARPKKRKEEEAVTPGTYRDTRSFIKVAYTEGDTAAYLNYGDVAQLRRLAMSGYVLKFYTFAYKGRGKAQIHKAKVLQYIRDQHQAMKNDKNPIDMYPTQEENRHIIPRTALAVCQMRRRIEKSISGSPMLQSEHEEAQLVFAELTGRRPPQFQVDTVELKTLGPFTKLGECELEMYNRCLNILAYVQLSSNEALWMGRFGSETWNESLRISLENQPYWMRINQRSPELAPDEQDPEHDSHIEAREFRVLWKHRSQDDANVSLITYLEEEDRDTGLVYDTMITLRSTTTRAEMRDIIRMKFKMDQISAQINALDLKPARLNIMDDDWNKIHDAMWTRPDPQINFSMTLRRLEDGEVLLENNEPAGLARLVVTTSDGDIVPIAAAPATTPEGDNHGQATYETLDNSHVIVELISRMTGNTHEFLNPMKLFKPKKTDKIKAMQNFWTIEDVSYDVTTPAGLLLWQQKAHEILTRRDKIITKEDGMSKRFGVHKLTPQQQDALSAADKDGKIAILGIADATSLEVSEHHYYALNSLHSGTQTQVGLPLLPSVRALELEEFFDGQDGKRRRYRSNLPGLEEIHFYPWQVTGITTCLVSMIGYIPLPSTASEDARNAAKELEGLPIGGKFICDSTGMGKTALLVAILFYARYHTTFNEVGHRIYEISHILVPAGVINQWVQEIKDKFPSLELIISYDATVLSEGYQEYCISAKTMKQYGHADKWPERFRYIFDETNPKTGSTVLLTTQDAACSRTLIASTELVHPGKRYDPPRFDPETGLEMWKIEPSERTIYTSVVQGKVGVSAVDEAQRLKDRNSRRWTAYARQEARYSFILGATPTSNTGADVVAQVELIWPCTLQQIYRAPEKDQEWIRKRKMSLDMYIDGETAAMSPTDPRRLGFLHPGTIRLLLEKGSHLDQARYFPLISNLLYLSRSMSSRIPLRASGTDYFDCKDALQPMFMRTIETDFLPEERPEQQILHRDASRRFLAMSRPRNKGDKDDKPIYPVAEMRELQMTAASTKLRVFNDICKGVGKDTLVDSLASYRECGFDGWKFVRFLCVQSKEAIPTTALAYMKYICEGSPLLRALLGHICNKNRFLKPRKEGKLLVLEDTPLIAMFLCWALNMFGVNTTLFHSGLSQKERTEMQEDFNDPLSPTDVMLCVIDVGGFGRNFHPDCSEVALCGAGKNQAAETQGFGRVVRAPAKKPIIVVKFFVKNSISGYREARKRDKARIELATRAGDPVIQDLLLRCLNEYQLTVKTVQADPQNQMTMKKLQEMGKIRRDMKQLQAKSAKDRLDLVVNETLILPRDRKAPFPKYTDNDYDRQGRFKKDASKKAVLDEGLIDQSDISSEEYDSDSDAGSVYQPPDNIDDDDTGIDDGDSDWDPDFEEWPPEQQSTYAEAMAARVAMRSEIQEDEALRRLRTILELDASKVYTKEDLQKEENLKRALDLAYCARQGMEYDNPPSIHISYSAIGGDLRQKIEKKVKVESDTKLRLVRLLENRASIVPTKVEKGYTPTVPDTTRNEDADVQPDRTSRIVVLPCPSLARWQAIAEELGEEHIENMEKMYFF